MPPELEAGAVAPEVPAVAQDQATTPEGKTDGPTEIESPEQQEERKFTQKELDDILQKRLAKAERKARQQALREFQELAQQRPQPQAEPDAKPARREGEADDDYLERLTDWKLEQREKKAAREKEAENARKMYERTEKMYAEASKLGDFDRDAFDDLPMTKPMVEALIDSDNGPLLMKYMADNPDDIERIARLSPARQAAELGKIEAKLAEAPRKQTSAPDPITPVRKPNARNPTLDTTDPRAAKELSTEEWMRRENERMRKRLGI